MLLIDMLRSGTQVKMGSKCETLSLAVQGNYKQDMPAEYMAYLR